MNRIICIGNRYIEKDALGAQVYEYLSRLELPADIELVDGGLAGLNLLPLMDNCERVIFVDAICGDEAQPVQVLRGDQLNGSRIYGHSSGLEYLLGAHNALGGSQMASVFVVGAGMPDATEAVARLALEFAGGAELHFNMEEERQ